MERSTYECTRKTNDGKFLVHVVNGFVPHSIDLAMADATQEVRFELDWPLKLASTTLVIGGVLGFLGGYRVCSGDDRFCKCRSNSSYR